jgi:E3 ubiquitin-protein ligase listerin
MPKPKGTPKSGSRQFTGFGEHVTFGSPKNAFGGSSLTSSEDGGLSYLNEPADLSGVSDPAASVLFKNLVKKKDATTKAKALEDLVLYARAHPNEKDGGVDDDIIETWVNLYPRLGIEESRRIRELSHALQLELLKSAKKRMEKRMPTVVGPWLAGTLDRERVVARAAIDGLASFLDTNEKTHQFWKRCQSHILNYATATLRETPWTISDQRITSKDDAESKYARAIGGAMALVTALVHKLDTADMEGVEDKYELFFASKDIWTRASDADPFVRKTLYQLVAVCLDKLPKALSNEKAHLSRSLTVKAVNCDQTGSAVDFLQVLRKFTTAYPSVWSSEKHPFVQLKPLFEGGSWSSPMMGSTSYWTLLDNLLGSIPNRSIQPGPATEVMRSLSKGISSRDEPLRNAVDAWSTYIATAERLSIMIEGFDGSGETARLTFVEATVFPLFDEYFTPAATTTTWRGAQNLKVLSRAFFVLAEKNESNISEALESLVRRHAKPLVDKLTSPLSPEHSDGRAHEKEVTQLSDHWFALVEAIEQDNKQRKVDSASALKPVESPSIGLIETAVTSVRKDLENTSAANSLASAFERSPSLLGRVPLTLVTTLFPVANKSQLGEVFASSSRGQLIRCYNVLGSIAEFTDFYETSFPTISSALLALGGSGAVEAITQLLGNMKAAKLTQQAPSLQLWLKDMAIDCARGEANAWILVEKAISSGAMATKTVASLANSMNTLLEDPTRYGDGALRVLKIIAKSHSHILSEDQDLHLELVSKFFGLMNLDNGQSSARSDAARQLLSNLDMRPEQVAKLVQANLDSADSSSLGVDVLVDQAVLSATSANAQVDDLFPNSNVWMAELTIFLRRKINVSLSLTSSLGGAYYLVEPGQAVSAPTLRDSQGFSIPARMAIYTSKLLDSNINMSLLPLEFQVELLILLYLTAEVAADQLVSGQRDTLWSADSISRASTDAGELFSSIQTAASNYMLGLRSQQQSRYTQLVKAVEDALLRQAREPTADGLYASKALSEILQSSVEGRTFGPTDEDLVAQAINQPHSSNYFSLPALVAGYGESLEGSKSITNQTNRLISEMSDATPDKEKTLVSIVLLNACLSVYGVGSLPVQKNRVVLAVRNITGWFESPDSLDSSLVAESCKALTRLLPCMKDVYGSFWERAVNFCLYLWDRAITQEEEDVRLPYIYWSLKLATALEAMKTTSDEDVNDDLTDAVTALADSKTPALLALLSREDDRNLQPAQVVDELLGRMIEKTPAGKLPKDFSDIFGLVCSESRGAQTAAYDVLHRSIPAAQSEISYNAVLDKKQVHLPDELMSLLMAAPDLDTYSDKEIGEFPNAIRSYLLSWRLVFDSYSNAAMRVKNDYTDDLKKAGCMAALLNLLVDVLGHSMSQPVNLVKQGLHDRVTVYTIRDAESEVEGRQMQWLLVNLYYLVLKHTPGLFLDWYRNIKSKQLADSVDSWTEKYFSPLIISDILDEVQAWADTEGNSGEFEVELEVKVSKGSKEVVVSYEVDEARASMLLKAPSNFPIDRIAASSINRAGASERKWTSWLRSTEAVIMVGNGSIIDGLLALRRMVNGAMEGQAECAICYSIVSPESGTPDRVCPTCKHAFHHPCLYKWFDMSSARNCPLCRNRIGIPNRAGGPKKR